LGVAEQIHAAGTIRAAAAVAIDLITNGNRIDFDADGDSSIRCSADDYMDFEVGGSDALQLLNVSGHINAILLATATDKTSEIVIKGPASFASTLGLSFKEGSGNGDANNMSYFLAYDASNTHFRLTSADIDGSSTPADIWRINDGQTTIDANTTWDDNVFDYVCDECGEHRAERFECCGNVEWHDDNALIFEATHAVDKRNALGRLEKLGVVNTYGTLENEKPEIFTRLQNAHMFTFSALAQLHKRIEELERKAA
jgi:hypothetical protein